MARRITIAAYRWPEWANATGLLMASVLGMAAISLHARPDSGAVAVLFPPWWNVKQAMTAAASANATIVRDTALPSILVVEPAAHDGLARLRNAGAWIMLDPQALGGCFKKINISEERP